MSTKGGQRGFYSVLKLFIGLDVAAFIVCEPIVTIAKSVRIINPGHTILSPELIRFEKLFKIRLQINSPKGIEIINPVMSKPIKFLDRVKTIFFSVAPSTFLRLISFCLLSTE
jgi:hypothetical protein